MRNLGGAKIILATAPQSRSITSLAEGLTNNGKLMIVAATVDPLELSPLHLILQRLSVQGWYSGHAGDSEDTLHFSLLSGIRPMIQTYPLEDVAEAYQSMLSGNARFRAVLKINPI